MQEYNTHMQKELLSTEKQTEIVSALYTRAKVIYKNAEQGGNADETAEKELLTTQKEFKTLGDKKGILFCQKALSIVYEKRGDATTDIKEKINCFELAHDNINDAVMQAQKMGWEQPSLLKRQGIIKSKLGDALHTIHDHTNANILEADAFKIYGKMLNSNPAYGEGYLETAAASFNKMKWSLNKILSQLNKAEALLNQPKYKKHLPDAGELNNHKHRIEKMRSNINSMLTMTL